MTATKLLIRRDQSELWQYNASPPASHGPRAYPSYARALVLADLDDATQRAQRSHEVVEEALAAPELVSAESYEGERGRIERQRSGDTVAL